jgi:hypothetical protein
MNRLMVSYADLRPRYGIRHSRESIRRWEKDKKWPRHFHVGRHAYWWDDEVREQIEKESKGEPNKIRPTE